MFNTLIDATSLATHLNDDSWVILDCRFDLADKDAGQRAYRAGHIPGAIYADLERHLSGPVTPHSGRHPLPAQASLVAILGRWGIEDQKQVVVYDNAGGGIAARCWWMLRWLGHDAVALLDGGLPAWESAGYPLSGDVRTPVTARFVDRHVEEPVTADQVRGEQGSLVMDARTAVRYRGDEEPIDPVAGHIPGAVSAPYEGNLDASGRFLPAARLRARFGALLGDRDPRSVVHYCGSGVTACHNLLAMEHAGLAGSRLYVGSWSEWITDPSRPVARGASMGADSTPAE